VAYTATEELAGIEGFDEEIAEALKERAQAYLDEVEQNLRAEAAELEMAEDLLAYDGLQLATIVELGRKGVKSLVDLADLAADELVELVPGAGLTNDDAGAIIMDARVRLGWIEAPAPEEEADEGAEMEEAEQH
jgi:N utilization substance protein A